MDPELIASALGRTELFGDLDPGALRELAARAVVRNARRGQYLFQQGDPGQSLFVLVAGQVKLLRVTESGDEMVIATAGPSDTFGELSAIDGGDRSASAQAVTQTRLLAVTHDELLGVMERHPRVARAMLRHLAQVIRRGNEQTTDLVFLDLTGRVAKLLLSLAGRYGRPGTPPAIVLDLELTQADLAQMVGGSRQSVNQSLRLLATRGLITLDGKRLIIERPNDVARRASG